MLHPSDLLPEQLIRAATARRSWNCRSSRRQALRRPQDLRFPRPALPALNRRSHMLADSLIRQTIANPPLRAAFCATAPLHLLHSLRPVLWAPFVHGIA